MKAFIVLVVLLGTYCAQSEAEGEVERLQRLLQELKREYAAEESKAYDDQASRKFYPDPLARGLHDDGERALAEEEEAALREYGDQAARGYAENAYGNRDLVNEASRGFDDQGYKELDDEFNANREYLDEPAREFDDEFPANRGYDVDATREFDDELRSYDEYVERAGRNYDEVDDKSYLEDMFADEKAYKRDEMMMADRIEDTVITVTEPPEEPPEDSSEVSSEATPMRCGWCRCGCAEGSPRQIAEPKANGCGSTRFPWWLRATINPFEFRSCCDEHDRCYGTCGNSRSDCDSSFLKCMTEKCDEQDDNNKRSCSKVARSFSYVARYWGCRSYRAFQKRNCDCI